MPARQGIRSRSGLYQRSTVFLWIAAAALGGCRPQEDASSSETGASAPAADCSVTSADIQTWIQSASVPAEPAGTSDACYSNFAWQDFFAMVRPQNGQPFTTWPSDQDLFPASGDPKPWQAGDRIMEVRPLRKALGLPGNQVTADIVTEAAALTPAVDQRGRWLHYSALADRQEYEYIRCCELYRGACFNSMGGVATSPASTSQINLPTPSLELKLSWRVLETCNLPDSPSPCTPEDASRFLTVQGEVQPYSPALLDTPVKATLGLLGMHIVHKTPQNANHLWATFEHVDNVPDCPPSGGATPPPPAGFTGWQLYNAECSDPKNPERCNANWYCLPCPVTVSKQVRDTFNSGVKPGSWTIPEKPGDPAGAGLITCTPVPNAFAKPIADVQITLFNPEQCKNAPIPTQVCRTTAISPEVGSLNGQVRQVLGQLGGSDAVFANYELVGIDWFDGQGVLQPAGRTALANSTMETYLQQLPQGCLTCHANQVNPVPARSPMQFNSALADRSFLFQQIRQFGVACSDQQAARCSAWAQGCPAQ